MRALVIKAPYQVAVEDRPIPVPEAEEVVVKVEAAALCGSDLHIYRGHQPVAKYDFVLGHELTGVIHSVGSSIQNFKIGQKVVSPFTINCGSCFFCERKQTARCVKSRVYGSNAMEGVQAEYARIPLADTTLFPAPAGVSEQVLILMADIFPTGFFVAQNAAKMLGEAERKDTTAVVIGCGPVGLCAVTAAKHFFDHVYAIDSVPARLDQAAKHGATPLHLHSSDPDVTSRIKQATGGRGADVVLEVVGNPSALDLAIGLVRNFGVISSCGLHTHELKLKGLDLYNKNIRFQFGRCSVRAIFPEALELLKKNADLFESFVENTVSIEEAPKWYELFEQQKCLKTVFTFGSPSAGSGEAATAATARTEQSAAESSAAAGTPAAKESPEHPVQRSDWFQAYAPPKARSEHPLRTVSAEELKDVLQKQETAHGHAAQKALVIDVRRSDCESLIPTAINLPAQTLPLSLPSLLLHLSSVPLVVFHCKACSSPTSRGVRSAGWYADALQNKLGLTDEQTAQRVAVLQGGIVAWEGKFGTKSLDTRGQLALEGWEARQP
ncbi:alcohol dehydrogenase [Ceraceosorus bombacis]|uniref:Alcohol dehydrogenase n=1 Tax=Ceraceosorus bombacis TaxID=401625 RepID=A0A0N7LAE3_9BASI|nr:alcohol dehydrogenase [Ceraceosorus bombacis]